MVPRQIDDHTTTGLAAHQTGGRPGGQHGPANVDSQQEVQLFERCQASRRTGEDVRAGVVDPDIDPSVCAVEVGGERLELAFDRHVELLDLDPTAQLPDQPRRLLRPLGIAAVGDRDLGAGPRAGDRDGAPDAARAAGDEHDLPRQAPVHRGPALALFHAASRCADPWGRLLSANIPLP